MLSHGVVHARVVEKFLEKEKEKILTIEPFFDRNVIFKIF